MEKLTITKDLLDELKTKRGGYPADALKELGVSWPPKKGWAKRLHGRLIPKHKYELIKRIIIDYDNKR